MCVLLSGGVRRAKRSSGRSRSIPTWSRVFHSASLPTGSIPAYLTVDEPDPAGKIVGVLRLRRAIPRGFAQDDQIGSVLLSGAMRRAKRSSGRSRSIPKWSRVFCDASSPRVSIPPSPWQSGEVWQVCAPKRIPEFPSALHSEHAYRDASTALGGPSVLPASLSMTTK